MSEHSKITASHRSRVAAIYVRQSTLAQLERNTESTARQYDLVEHALAMGSPRGQVRVIDADLGVSGSVLGQRAGFESLVADVALGQVGIIFALEVSRLARDNGIGCCWIWPGSGRGARHAGRRRRRGVSPGAVQRSPGAGHEGDHERGRVARSAGRRDRNKAARGQLRTGLPVG